MICGNIICKLSTELDRPATSVSRDRRHCLISRWFRISKIINGGTRFRDYEWWPNSTEYAYLRNNPATIRT